MKIVYFPVFLIPLLMGATAFAQPGTLDASFGVGGKVITTVGDSSSVVNAVAITPNGKIIIGGQSFIAGQSQATLLQYNNDGTIDSAFGKNGKATLSLNNESIINSIALQPDGKIVAGSYYKGYNPFYYSHFLIARFMPNGSLDSSFGMSGMANTVLDSSIGSDGEAANKIIIKPDGKIAAGGLMFTKVFTNVPFITQYLPNGTIDSSFGRNGEARVGMNMYVPGVQVDNINDIIATADGKLTVVVEEAPNGILGYTDFNLNRLLPNGNHDTTFGDSGVVRTDIDSLSTDYAYSAVVLPDSSIVVAGYSSASLGVALVKYRVNGILDSSFGMNGKVLTPTAGYLTETNQILLLPDRKLIVSGYTYSPRNFVVIKYLPESTLDSSFGTNGITTTDFSGTDDFSYSSALQSDGKIVLAGSEGTSTNYNIALARYNNALIVPLHLLSFTATKNGGSNLLQWQTAQEINTSLYEVQRSVDGKNYSAIGYITAGKNVYQFIDDKPIIGTNYYRLKIIDRDGSFIYSPIRLIKNSYFFTVKIYPNPAKDHLQIQINSDKGTVLRWQVLSLDGKVLIAGRWSLLQTDNSVKNIDVAVLSKGSYYLMVTTKDNQQRMVKFEKL